jgi:hypothetical protein
MNKFFVLILCLGIVGCSTLPTASNSVPPASKNQAVVFDIDGTLTPSIPAIYTARPYAAEVVNAFAKKGYQIFYISARHPWFQSGIPGWLKYNGFPEGSLYLPSTVVKTNEAGKYKSKVLKDLANAGWRFRYAYGDQATDHDAYSMLELGLTPERIFGLRRDGSGDCEQGFAKERCLKMWEEHLSFLTDIPAASAD